MSAGTKQVRQGGPLFLVTGIAYLLFLAAGCSLFLAIANLRSRLYYDGPNYSFLFWIFLYCPATAFGLLGHRRWAVIALFVPGLLTGEIFVWAVLSHSASDAPSLLFIVGFVAIVVGVPATMLRSWHELRW